MTASAPKTTTNSWKIEPGDLWIWFLMSFCRSSFLNDSTTIFMVFQVLGVPWKTINPLKLIPIITFKLHINKTLSKVRFVSKTDVSSPLKLHPKSLKIELGTPWSPPGDPKVPQSSSKHLQALKKYLRKLFQAIPIQQKRTQNHRSRAPVTLEGPAAGGEALKIYTYTLLVVTSPKHHIVEWIRQKRS